jgi:hypothetical protein
MPSMVLHDVVVPAVDIVAAVVVVPAFLWFTSYQLWLM